jgi:2-polyprenyl-3-methyl-5-hydroxy-6-metoxy-1,4-benzoquinol methylase
MNIEDQVKFYDQYWSDRKPLNSLKLRRAVKILEYMSTVKRKINNPRIIDLGCGDGRFTSFIGMFGKTDGLELSEKAVEEASRLYPHVKFMYGSALDYTLPENTYDVVISQEVIEHIEDQAAYLEVCHRILKEKGFLILTTPNKKVFDHMEGGNWSKQPIENILTPKELKKVISEYFEIKFYDSIIMNFGDLGYFKLLNHRFLIGGANRLGIRNIRDFLHSKFGLGLHQCILAQKS